jgi:hypothetical protein
MGLLRDMQESVASQYGKRWVKVATVAVIIAIAFILGMVGSLFADVSVPLVWTEPVLNCDGSNLDDLAGYIVLWWNQASPGTIVELDVGLVTTTTVSLIGNVEGLTYVFAVVSKDENGNRSDDPDGCGTSPQKVAGPFPATVPGPPPTLQ